MAVKAERSNSAVERVAADLAPCDSVLVNIETLPAGIVGTAIDGDAYALTIDYDPRRISDESVRQSLFDSLQRYNGFLPNA